MKNHAIIVDDNKDIAAMFSHVLEFVGFETEIITDGKRALDRLEEVVPVLMLLDLKLYRDVSGLDILEHIRSDEGLSKIHIIVVTGYPHLANAVADKVDLVLIKPISMPQLSALVSRVCSNLISDTFFKNASYNALTGLPNRAMLKERLGYAIARKKRYEAYNFAVLVLQVSDLEKVRQEDGYQTRNDLLVAFVRRLQSQLREVDMFAHIDEDIFVILLDGIHKAEDASIVVGRLHEALELPFHVNNQEFSLSADVQITPGIHTYNTPDEILRATGLIVTGE